MPRLQITKTPFLGVCKTGSSSSFAGAFAGRIGIPEFDDTRPVARLFPDCVAPMGGTNVLSGEPKLERYTWRKFM